MRVTSKGFNGFRFAPPSKPVTLTLSRAQCQIKSELSQFTFPFKQPLYDDGIFDGILQYATFIYVVIARCYVKKSIPCIVRTIKPTEKPLKLFDGGGLFSLVTPSGGKLIIMPSSCRSARR